ncbi:unnamed protein product, partial [Meganyctiphanes norvegica]
HSDVNMKFLLTAVVLAAVIHQGTSFQCYYCTNTNNLPSFPYPHDDNCSNSDYSDPNFILEFPEADGCFTWFYSDGTVSRSGAHGTIDDGDGTVPMSGAHGTIDDGECLMDNYETICFCTQELCNNELCENCVQ